MNDLVLRQLVIAGNADVLDAKAKSPGQHVRNGALPAEHRLIMATDHKAGADGGQNEEDRSGGTNAAGNTKALLTATGGPLGAPVRARFGKGAEPAGYRSTEASSTIHSTSSLKLRPFWAASSGTSEVSVIPGCVFTSRQTSVSVSSS